MPDARSEKIWVSQQNWRTSDTIQRHISGTTEDLLIVIVRNTLALISPSSWKTLIRWKVHHRFDKGRWWNSTTNWLAPGVKSLHQIMRMSQCQELDHKGTLIQSDGQKHTLNSLPKILGFARKSGYHFFNLPSHVIVCTIQACLDPSGVWNRKHRSSHQCS